MDEDINEKKCDFCDHHIRWNDEDEFYLPETIDGQYVEINSITCPFCECTNQLG